MVDEVQHRGELGGGEGGQGEGRRGGEGGEEGGQVGGGGGEDEAVCAHLQEGVTPGPWRRVGRLT